MARIRASTILGNGFPADEGHRLAQALLENQEFNWSIDQVDLCACDPAMLVSAFFRGFLETVHERRPHLLGKARSLNWETEFDFQNENVRNCMVELRPHSGQS